MTQPTRLRGVIFDMDGVLVDSEPFLAEAAIRMFAEKGHDLRPEEFRPFIGMGEDRYLGGAADEVFSLLTNVFLVIPGLPLVIVISGFVPRESRGLWTIAVVLALTSWAASARVLRAQTLSVRHREYVSASRLSGERAWRVIVVEILPNLLPVLASQFAAVAAATSYVVFGERLGVRQRAGAAVIFAGVAVLSLLRA